MEKLIDQLTAIVGPERVLSDPARLDDLSWDALSVTRIHPLRQPEWVPPLCALLPKSTDEIRRIVILANREKLPIVPFGGGSGLMGGALSLHPGIVIDLRAMDNILEIDPDSRMARVEAGVVLQSLDKRLNQEGLMLGHDPWTLPVATIGGAISTDSLGYRAGKYGSMGDQVLGMEVVLPGGEVLRTRPVPKFSTGISLKHLFIGGEGCFGIITEATLRVFPMPERRSLHAIRFASFEQGFAAIQKIFAAGLRPALVDYGDSPAKFARGAVLYLALEGAERVVEAEEQTILTLCDRGEGERLPSEEAERFWNERHVIATRFMQNRRRRRERGDEPFRRDWIHVALPASRVLSFREKAMEILAKRGVRLLESGLWTQPELFSMALAVEESGREQAQWLLQETVDELLRMVQEMGGSMEYCHGVGIKLAAHMAREHGCGLEAMRVIKRALDPNNIMNPGKLGL